MVTDQDPKTERSHQPDKNGQHQPVLVRQLPGREESSREMRSQRDQKAPQKQIDQQDKQVRQMSADGMLDKDISHHMVIENTGRPPQGSLDRSFDQQRLWVALQGIVSARGPYEDEFPHTRPYD